MPSILDPFLSRTDYVSDGVTLAYAITFAGSKPSTTELPYIQRSDVKVYDVTPATETTGEVVLPIAFRWLDDYNIELYDTITVDHVVRIQRDTFNQYNLTDYNNTSQITEADLELSQRQLIFLAQEAADLARATALLVASGNSTDVTVTPVNTLQFYKDNTPLGTPASLTKVRFTGNSVNADTPDVDTVVYAIASSNVSVINATVPSGGAIDTVNKADGLHIDSLMLTGDTITLTVAATTGAGTGKPTVTVGDTTVTISNPTANTNYWEGTVVLNVAETTTLTITSSDAFQKTLAITKVAAPVITNISMSGTYPNSQTEHANGQQVTLTVNATTPFDRIVILSGGALTAGEYAVPLGLTANVLVPVAATSNIVTVKSVSVYIKTPSNAYSAEYTSTSFGSVDGVHTLKCNDITPTNTLSSIVYASGYSALKDNELATVTPNLANHTSVLWEVVGTELALVSSSTFAGAMQVSRVTGDYNISSTNLRLTAYRSTNGTSTVLNITVWIANVVPTVTISVPSARLRSSPTGNPYVVTLTASQRITLSSVDASVGTFSGSWTSYGSGVTWTRSLSISDTDTKGTATFSNLSAINLAGKSVTVITTGASYVVGGFLKRQVSMSAWPNREGAIGTNVVNTAKLQATNLSKGASDSLNTSFVASVGDAVDTFTITSPSGVFNATGNTLYNRDVFNAVSNTTTIIYEIEEIV